MERQIFRLAHAEARRRAVAAVTIAPDFWIVRVSPPTRTLEQNAKLHALLGDIAERREWANKKWDIEAWKRLLVGAWSRAQGSAVQMLPALDGAGVEVIYRQTSALSVAEVADLIDWIEAWDATDGET